MRDTSPRSAAFSTVGGRPVPSAWNPFERIAVFTLVLGSFLLSLRHLGHRAITHWDEVFHALAARNLLKHPLMPTLIDRPYFPYDFKIWTENYVWLHKPILPLWEIALSYAVLGVNTFALRLPAALLSAGAVLLTYLIGRELFDRRAAVVAATVQAVNPAILSLVHGYLFSDVFDVNLLFFVELGVYCIARAMRTGSWTPVLIAGVAQGLAFLSKSYLAVIITGIALAAWLAPTMRLGRREDTRVRGLHVLGLLAATCVTVAPWMLYAMLHYPNEFWFENVYVFRHLNQGLEGWGSPWDRVVFDYSIVLYSLSYTPVLVAAFALIGQAFTRRDTQLWIAYAWGLGVLVPHLVSATKTPSATVFGLPAFWLLLGVLVSQATRGNRRALTGWVTIVALCFLFPPVLDRSGMGNPSPNTFGTIMFGALWVVWHVAGTFAVIAVVEMAVGLSRRWRPIAFERFAIPFRRIVVGIGIVASIVLGARLFNLSWQVTERNQNEPTFSDIAEYARTRLPDNAVLIHEEEVGSGGDHRLTTFLSYRTGYSTFGTTRDEVARHVREGGGIPYFVTDRDLPLPRLYSSEKDRRTIYELATPVTAQEVPR